LRQRETGHERHNRQVRELREELGVSHDEARQRWGQYYAPGGASIRSVRHLQLAIRASTTNQRTCPFCRDAIYPPEEGGPDYVCTNCQTHYHLDCFEEELGGCCATLGCATRRVIGQARARIQTRGHRPIDVTPATPITRARNDGAMAQELDAEDYRRQQRTARLAQDVEEVEEAQDTYEPQNVPQAARERLWERLRWRWEESQFRQSVYRDGPLLLGVLGLMVVVILVCWLVALGIAG